MMNFTTDENKELFAKYESFLLERRIKGYGRKFENSLLDTFLMVLTAFKNVDMWDVLGTVFKMKCASLQRLITKFVRIFEEWSFIWSVLNQERKQPMSYLPHNNIRFTYHKYARYATDIIFRRFF